MAMGRVAGVAIAVLGLAGVPAWGGVSVATAQEPVPDWTKAQTAEVLRDELPELAPYIETHFPDDYDFWIGEMTALVRGGMSEDDFVYASAELAAVMRLNHVHMLGSIPDDMARDLIDQLIALNIDILDEQGEAICAQYAMLGPMVLADDWIVLDYIDDLNAQVLTFFTAVVAAREAPRKHDAVTGAARETFFARLRDRGMSESQFRALETIDGSHPETCYALTLYLETINADDLPNGPALRAEYLQLAFGYDMGA